MNDIDYCLKCHLPEREHRLDGSCIWDGPSDDWAADELPCGVAGSAHRIGARSVFHIGRDRPDAQKAARMPSRK